MKAIDPNAKHEIVLDGVTYVCRFYTYKEDCIIEDYISSGSYKLSVLTSMALNIGLLDVIGLDGLTMKREEKASIFEGLEYKAWTDDTLTAIPKEHRQKVSVFIATSNKHTDDEIKN
jgi:hypothetical protein